ncbi:hypothetical protein BC831DRAFT_436079 [Entophlyctis helioformis]|nr:hypothetical protein BC831DRAFT_436079 [Entophlyctis helioformis]
MAILLLRRLFRLLVVAVAAFVLVSTLSATVLQAVPDRSTHTSARPAVAEQHVSPPSVSRDRQAPADHATAAGPAGPANVPGQTANRTANRTPQSQTAQPRSDLLTTAAALRPSWSLVHGHAGARDAVAIARHVCLDTSHALFLPSVVDSNGTRLQQDGPVPDMPRINLGGSADTMDVWASVPVRSLHESRPVQIVGSRDLFTLGGVWEYHLSHFFMNNALPLINSLNVFYETEYPHLLAVSGPPSPSQASSQAQSPPLDWISMPRDLYAVGGPFFDMPSLRFTNVWRDFKSGSPEDLSQPLSPPSAPASQPSVTPLVCYQYARIGLNSTCDCCGCMHELPQPKKVYQQMRRLVFERHLTAAEQQQATDRINTPASDRAFHMVIVQRRNQRRIINLDAIQEYLTTKRNASHEVVFLEDRTFTQQVALFALNATALLTIHGNALGNAFWMPPGSLVIEAHSYKQGSAWFEHLFSDAGGGPMGHALRYAVIKCKDESCSDEGKSEFNAGTVVNLDKLDAILDNYWQH